LPRNGFEHRLVEAEPVPLGNVTDVGDQLVPDDDHTRLPQHPLLQVFVAEQRDGPRRDRPRAQDLPNAAAVIIAGPSKA
jgi:hypothetical protein